MLWHASLRNTRYAGFAAVLFALSACVPGWKRQGEAAPPADNTPPCIAISAPQEGEELPFGEIEVMGSVTDASMAWVQVDGTAAWMRGTEFLVRLPARKAGKHKIEVTAHDAAGNRAPPVVWTLWVDETPPEVLLREPDDGAKVISGEIFASGAIRDRSDIASVVVNGKAAFVARKMWNATLDATPGEFVITVIAADSAGNQSEPIAFTRQLLPATGWVVRQPHPGQVGPIHAKIIKVSDDDPSLIVISAGDEDGVEEGDEFDVYRGAEFVGKAKVERTSRSLSAAKIIHQTHEPKSGDQVTPTRLGKIPRF